MALTKVYNADAALDQQMAEEEEQQIGMAQGIKNAAQGKRLTPKMQKEIDGYKTVLSKLLHSKQMRGNTLDLLKAGPPEVSVPNAALAINGKAESLMADKGIKLSVEAKLAGSIFLVSDLIEIGNKAAGWEDLVDEEEAKAIYQDALQDYIHRGLKDGSIDPIELQQDAEPLMSEEQKVVGSQIAKEQGIPMQVTTQQAIGSQTQREKLKMQQKQQPMNRG